MILTPITCAYCGKAGTKPTSAVNRAQRIGAPLYCDKVCAALGRRKPPKTREQRVEEKRLYDAEYRKRNLALLKAKKAAYYAEHHDREKEAAYRAIRMPKHVEYCRQPAYKRKKRVYDRKYRAAEYGEFAEAYLLAVDINHEIKERSTRHEIYQENGTAAKTTRRKRAARLGTIALG